MDEVKEKAPKHARPLSLGKKLARAGLSLLLVGGVGYGVKNQLQSHESSAPIKSPGVSGPLVPGSSEQPTTPSPESTSSVEAVKTREYQAPFTATPQKIPGVVEGTEVYVESGTIVRIDTTSRYNSETDTISKYPELYVELTNVKGGKEIRPFVLFPLDNGKYVTTTTESDGRTKYIEVDEKQILELLNNALKTKQPIVFETPINVEGVGGSDRPQELIVNEGVGDALLVGKPIPFESTLQGGANVVAPQNG